MRPSQSDEGWPLLDAHTAPRTIEAAMLTRPFVGVVVLVSLLARCGASGNEDGRGVASPSPAASAPPSAVSRTRAPKPSSKRKPSAKPASCPSQALRGDYHAYRL